MKRLEWMVLIFLIPLPMFACSLREIPTINIRSTVIALFNNEPEEELVWDRIIVTPLATLTPTSTPTFTPTLQPIPSVRFLPPGPASPPATPGDLPAPNAAESSTGSGSGGTAVAGSTPTSSGPLPPPTLLPTPVSSLVPTVLPSPSLSPVPTVTPEPTLLPPTLTAPLPSPTSPPPPPDEDDDDDDTSIPEPPTDTPTPEPPPLPVLAFAAGLYNVNEIDGSALITISLATPSSRLITVDYATGDGTATAGSDYTAVNGTLTVTPGLASAAFIVPIHNDLAIEPDQSLNLLLSNPVNTLLDLNTATLLIIDTCTLPDAITSANTDSATGGCGAGSGDDTIDLEITGPIYLNGPLPNLSSNMVINAPGNLTIQRATGGDYRIFTVDSGSIVTLSGVTIANGQVSGDGGGIFNAGILTLANSAVMSNTASGGVGGGIANTGGSLTLFNATVRNNTADGGPFRGGGGIWNDNGSLTLTDSTISHNTAVEEGGGIFNINSGIVTLSDSTVSDNIAFRGGGIQNRGDTVTLNNSVIRNNIASNGYGGGVDNIFGATLTLNSSAVINNSASGGGGGIDNFGLGSTITLVNSLVDGNSAGISGGGIFVDQASTVSLTGSTVSNNNTVNDGGGISSLGDLTLMDSTISGNTASLGGGIYNGGIFVATNSTINNNTANFPLGYGGGINQAGNMTLTNVTISNNSAADDGGGLQVVDGSPTLIRHSTIVNNTANGFPGEGAGIFYFSGPAVITVFNTIIANNLAAGSQNGDCFGLVPSQGYNLASDNSCWGFTATGDLTNTDPQLDPLQNNGGPTETRALLPGSPAIDAGSCAGATTDQRGENRPVDQPEPNADDGCDIGAFELQ